MKSTISLLIALGALLLIACSQNSKNIDQFKDAENWEVFEEGSFSIQFPDSFELEKKELKGIRFVLFSELTSPDDLFRENINLLIQDLWGTDIDLEKYVEITVEQAKSLIADVVIEKSELVKNSPNGAFNKVIYSGKQDGFDLKWLQYFWVFDERAFVLTLTTEVDEFDNYFTLGEKIMNTFEIKT